ncbi:hypothetical protein H6F67_05045 [Microcoleus sp. FACHB-1515]|uniref:hypothetical protein n=1 Tax=Cyanophyceae TaxID=3028117 RepID=UPI00168865A3|nr:hypothetical protein [Microcoleus sp. FACHB-1515]MBD2089217.1 hypothetical protein [Microcoleus sp. FACHB-1515]
MNPRFIRLPNSGNALSDWLSFSVFDFSSQTISCISAAAKTSQALHHSGQALNLTAIAAVDERQVLASALVSDRASHRANNRESDFACDPLAVETLLSYLPKIRRISTLLMPHMAHRHSPKLASNLADF